LLDTEETEPIFENHDADIDEEFFAQEKVARNTSQPSSASVSSRNIGRKDENKADIKIRKKGAGNAKWDYDEWEEF